MYLQLEDDTELLTEDLLAWIADIHRCYPDATLVNSDGVEDPDQQSQLQLRGPGHGSFVKHFVQKAYQWTAQAPPVNPVTLTHVLALPRHTLAWKAEVLAQLYRQRTQTLPVADNYELLLLTFLHSNPGSWVRIAFPAHRREGGLGHGDGGRLLYQLVARLHARYSLRLSDWPPHHFIDQFEGMR